MSRWYGSIGFSTQVEADPENHPSVYEQKVIEKKYYGEMNKKVRQWISDNQINNDIRISNTLTIYSDPYMTLHYGDILYITWLGKKWKVESADYANYPKITLQIGGIYNEQTS